MQASALDALAKPLPAATRGIDAVDTRSGEHPLSLEKAGTL
jgi:hypothetical protein